MRPYTRHISGMLQLASATDIIDGKEWYDRAHRLAIQFIHRYDGLTMGQAVGVIAALSPNNKWERNCIDAEAMIKTWHIGGDYSMIKVCTFNKNKEKAIAILNLDMESADAEAIQEILSGQKVVSFYRSIMGDHDNVCVDGHAYAIYMGERIPTTKTPSIGKELYSTIQRGYKLVADRSVELCGHKLTPIQVQAVTWVTYRRLINGK
jgi:hypothetical protein